ncbi:MAG: 50S ribosomal protein L9 [Micrococcales bacterium]|nr:50S ribosomal protein L9 [Micrococcales bacterium]
MAKIILTHEVDGLGTPGDIIEVKDGYARNYLVPRRLATPWTKGAAKQIEALRRATRAKEMASVEDALAAAELLRTKVVEVQAKAGAGGRLFGTVTTDDVAKAVKAATGLELDKRKLDLSERIKTTGEYTITAKLHESVTAPLTLRVLGV